MESEIDILTTNEGRSKLMSFAQKVSKNSEALLNYIYSKLPKQEEEVTINNLWSKKLQNFYPYLNNKVTTASPICAKVLEPHQFAFRCYECQMQQNSIICLQCFSKSNHEGHNYQKIAVAGGCCDCGDDQKWKPQGFCTDHNLLDEAIKIDQKLTEQFENDLQFILQIIQIMEFHKGNNHYKRISNSLKLCLVEFLYNFNTNSMVSNQMTFHFFTRQFSRTKLIEILLGQPLSNKSIPVLIYLFSIHKSSLDNYCKILTNVFITMFTRPAFKRYLTIQYTNYLKQDGQILQCQLSGISCQIYTSHKLISALIKQQLQSPSDTDRFSPVELSPLSPQLPFSKIAGIYSRYYIDLNYLLNLYNGVGSMYSKYHLEKADICRMADYKNYTALDKDNISYYGIQRIYINYLCNFIIGVKGEKQTLLKAMRDVVNNLSDKYIQLQQECQLFIPRERTLIILILQYCQGNMDKIFTTTFMDRIGLTPLILYRLLQSSLMAIRFYALIMSSKQMAEHYYTFYAFSIKDKPRTLYSVDVEMMKFSLNALSLYPKLQLDFIAPQALGYDIQNSYQKMQFPVDNLISSPIYQVLEQIEQPYWVLDHEAIYDRKKALLFLTDYLGLLVQMCLTEYTLTHIYLALEQSHTESIQKQLLTILKSMGSCKIKQFLHVAEVLFDENQKAYSMEQFVKKYCSVDNGKIYLNPEIEAKVSEIDLSLYKSLKLVTSFDSYIEKNHKKSHCFPVSLSNTLTSKLFPNVMLDCIVKVLKLYTASIEQILEVTQMEGANVQAFVGVLLPICSLLGERTSQINLALKHLMDSPVFQVFTQLNKKKIKEFFGDGTQEDSSKKQEQQAERKKRLAELKKKKLKKFQEKHKKLITSMPAELNINSDEIQQQLPTCMFCKLTSSQTQPLSIICFKTYSTFLTKKYLECDTPFPLVTTCGHMVHEKCHKDHNPNRVYFYCYFCKTSSNCIIQSRRFYQCQEENLQQKVEMQDMIDMQESEMQQNQAQYQQQELIDNIDDPQNMSQPFQGSSIPIQKKPESLKVEKLITVVHSIAYGLLVDYNFFNRALAKPTAFLLGQLKREYRINFDHEQVSKLFELSKSTIFKAVLEEVMTILDLKNKNENQKKDINGENSQIFALIPQILDILCNSESLLPLQHFFVPQNPPTLREFPETLHELAKNIGQCPNCHRVTNQICLCVSCSFVTCLRCESKNLSKHTKEEHSEGTVFVQVDEGVSIYIGGDKVWWFGPIYKNFLGEMFSMTQVKTKNREDYKLDHHFLDEIKADIVRHRIQQKIRYAQVTTNKVNPPTNI